MIPFGIDSNLVLDLICSYFERFEVSEEKFDFVGKLGMLEPWYVVVVSGFVIFECSYDVMLKILGMLVKLFVWYVGMLELLGMLACLYVGIFVC